MYNTSRLDLKKIFPKLEHPPIREAVLEFQVSHEEGSHIDEMIWENENKKFSDLFLEKDLDYPKIKPIRDFHISAKVRTGEVEVTNKSKGIRFSSRSPKKMTTFQMEKFVFHWQSEYDCWDVFVEEGMKLWFIFNEFFQPQFIQRIGLRFINYIEVGLDVFELDDYFVGSSDITKQIGGIVNHFSTEEGVVFTGVPYQSIIRKSLIREDSQSYLVFDTDVFLINKLEPLDEEMLLHINTMRSIKNHLFFNCITENVILKYGVIQ